MSLNTGEIIIRDAHSKADPPRPVLYRYHNYREFLKDWLQFLKATKPGFSTSRLALELGIAPGFITMLLKGARGFSEGLWDRLIHKISLSQTEISYLSLLRQIADSESPEAQLSALKKAQKFKGYREANQKEIDAYQYMTEWYYVAIREMTALPSFKADPSWIQSQLRRKVSLPKIRKALDFLKDRNLIEINEDGSGRPTGGSVTCDGGVFRLVLAKFHKEMFQITADAFADVEREKRMILGRTVTLPEDTLPEVTELLNETRERIKEIERKSRASKSSRAVYHISLGAVPLTYAKGEE